MELALAVLTPRGLAEPALAIAASRAGGVGLLDLSGIVEESVIEAAVTRLRRFGRAERCGIKIDARETDSVDLVKGHLPGDFGWIVVAPGESEETAAAAEALRGAGRDLLIEAVDRPEAELGRELEFDGVIAKGAESGGRVGEQTAFVLLQELFAAGIEKIWVQGGIGPSTVAACAVGGATGAMLDAQLWLAREASLPESCRQALRRMDGLETTVVGAETGEAWRVHEQPGSEAVAGLRKIAKDVGEAVEGAGLERWRETVRRRVAVGDSAASAWPIGQDGAQALSLTCFRTVGGVLAALRERVEADTREAARRPPFAHDAPLARSHGTRYPVVQGPMTRVSDQPEFAAAVAEAGGLPFIALALMRGSDVRSVLRRTSERLAERPWGVGILGFVPPELRAEQLEEIRRMRPPYALIAGGRPDQALALEENGTATYLHVPSPGLLRLFAGQGARRFVFEGRECGGHVGPLSSFSLWNAIAQALVESIPSAEREAAHVLFAGGIHDARSAAMAAAMAAPLADLGIRVGVLMGTAYLFTQEAVASGAIVPGFQGAAIECSRTVLLETGPGHATRCSETPYARTFAEERSRLLREHVPPDRMREQLERLNLGRLRIAAKALERASSGDAGSNAPKLRPVETDAQARDGMYMLGQVAALRDQTTTAAELHREVADGSAELLGRAAAASTERKGSHRRRKPLEVAIVGMGCLVPGAQTIGAYWQNILNRFDAITEVPAERWDWKRYFDPDEGAKDGITSRWGGFIDDVVFDPLRYGLPPSALPSIEPMQLLALEVVRSALDDAGYGDRPFPRDRTSVVLGVGGGLGDLGHRYALRSGLPTVLDPVPPELLEGLPEWTEDSFPGVLLNVTAGRIANRFDLGGVNYTVDAACASSLAAIHLGARELELGTSEVVIAGGVDTVQSPFGYLCFSSTHALSPTGRCRPFDSSADGISISEGIAAIVLKRLADAERDGDRIYALVRAVEGSSDGRDRGLTAPRPEGQVRALNRAYAKAGFSPATIGLVEAHGTGTVAGDRAELETLQQVFGDAGAGRESCAIGSVKSMIGHTKCAAGVAGVIKAALALHHRTLPPTINIERPNPQADLRQSPLYVNTEARPWIHAADWPRRAGASAFGFGGTNFHAVLEEYTGDYLEQEADAALLDWPAELLIWAAGSRSELLGALRPFADRLGDGEGTELRELAVEVWEQHRGAGPIRLAIVATSVPDLCEKLSTALGWLVSSQRTLADLRGVYATDAPLLSDGSGMAFLFPGQGSQQCDMLGDLAISFSEVRETFERADRALATELERPLSAYIFPPPRFAVADRSADEAALRDPRIAQPALGAAGLATAALLERLGLHPDAVAGHSYGEYVALCAGGALGEQDLYRLSFERGASIVDCADDGDLGTMVAVGAAPDRVRELLGTDDGVTLANLNSPRQVVLSGSRSALEAAVEKLEQDQIATHRLDVACAFHSPLVAPAGERLRRALDEVEFTAAALPVYANATARPYPQDGEQVRELLGRHLVEPVRFADQIRRMHEDGTRVFVEMGPRSVLTGLVREILAEEEHTAVATGGRGQPDLVRLLHALARLSAEGAELALDRLWQGRRGRPAGPDVQSTGAAPGSTWLVNGGRARPASGAEPLSRPVSPAALVPPEIPWPRDRPPMDGLGDDGDRARPASNGRPPLDGRAGAALQFQELMDDFLATQQRVMLRFLSGNGAVAQRPSETVPAQPAITPEPVPAARVADPAAGLPDEPSPPDQQSLAGEAAAAMDPMKVLVGIVSERTGYPPEMLDPEMDLEAELGIDSIKRVEIATGFYAACLGGEPPGGDAMEAMIGEKSLNGLVLAMRSLSGGAGPPPSPEPAKPNPLGAPEQGDVDSDQRPAPSPRAGGVPRFLLELREAEPARPTGPLDGTFIVTDDGSGVASSVVEGIADAGGRATLVSAGELAEPEAAAARVDAAQRAPRPLKGIVHLAPLRAPSSSDPVDALDEDLTALFHLTRAAAPALAGGSHQSPAWLLAATHMDGGFGVSPNGRSSTWAPSQGAVAGFVKAIADEWPHARARVVDFDETAGAAELILAELRTGGEREVGYRGSRRQHLRLRAAPFADGVTGGLAPSSDWVILVTGGGRGVTAAVALELAQRYRPTLILVGRSRPPSGEQDPLVAQHPSLRELRPAVIESLSAAGKDVSPREVERVCRELLRDREIRQTLSAAERAGATARYLAVDVRDTAAVERMVESIYDEHGRIDGVIHGAGLIEDKLIADKSTASFERVIETKVRGATALAGAVRPDSLRFFALFSSIAGRFGNAGQCDYAAANEYLNKLALKLDRTWPGRVMALNWGPWDGFGMASPEVRRRFEARGVELVDPVAGRRAFIDELERGRKGEVEVVLGGGPWSRERDLGLPLFSGEAIARTPGGLRATLHLDPERDRLLDEHRIDGRAVLPAAVALEAMVEAARAASPDLDPVEVREFGVQKGIVVSEPAEIEIEIETADAPDGAVEASARITAGSGEVANYRGTVLLGHRLEAPVDRPAPLRDARPCPLDRERLYAESLFQGPLFQRIEEVTSLSDSGIEAVICPSDVRAALGPLVAGGWLADPIVLDCAFQLAIVWSQLANSMTPLPVGFERLRLFDTLAGAPLRCRLDARSSVGGHVLETEISFARDGHLVAVIDRMRFSCTRSLNRLAPGRPMSEVA